MRGAVGAGRVRVFLVLPDLSPAKAEALERAAGARGAPVDVLVSAGILALKPGVEGRLARARRGGSVGLVMLDSGAYHHVRGEVWVGVGWYAGLASRLAGRGLVDLVVAPDVPGDPRATLARSLEFAGSYPGPFVPVAQPPPGPPDPTGHASQLAELARAGLLDRAPRLPGGALLVGVGGLDGQRRRAGYVARLVEEVERGWGDAVKLHLFGVGARVLRALARRGLLDAVYSVDTTAWLAEIRFRRRSVYGALGVVDANVAAITGYLARVEGAVGGAAV